MSIDDHYFDVRAALEGHEAEEAFSTIAKYMAALEEENESLRAENQVFRGAITFIQQDPPKKPVKL